ncbi:MAG: rhodanese-like domain-containing protein [Candidatus Eisenbacteria bacterium]|uniref:Rhodanese-like domain-containing protein n=1 Tax=Eiseniibacteriota bacterium TaxID=2212470 RepID=A0A948RYL6_UNCEI|nr:rhodanese-like domain-containing protein [Candidatus Eisenbacteria bacterium]MBU1947966.1 rhodanese-like domain-containing protein [Candidatus Eisenbacteria bacterium]MBU2693410.1 rhodanese-like domain-containing protein [Candidatus Eisenbacteria bacterium]
MHLNLRRGFLELFVLVILTIVASYFLQRMRAEPLPTRIPSEAWTIESSAVWVSPSRAVDLYNKGNLLFVDIREEESFREGHIPGAINLPVSRLRELYDTFLPWAQGQRLCLYGEVENAADLDEALLELEDLGHTALTAFPYGWDAWVHHGGKIESGADGVLEPAWEEYEGDESEEYGGDESEEDAEEAR